MGHVGEEVRRLREARGWTQPHLAVESGIAVSGISLIENGRRNPGAGTLNRLARALGVHTGDLFPKVEAPLQLEFAGAGQAGGGTGDNLVRILGVFNEALYKMEKTLAPDREIDWSREAMEEISALIAKAANRAASAGLAVGVHDTFVEAVQVLTRADRVVRLLDDRAVTAPTQVGPLPQNVVELNREFGELLRSVPEHQERLAG
jgi:transcriptional regulator with XRE-family HTH domain